ncbi:MAG: 1-acyl-sn-glycerol-3-phosphate acyltransferase [Pseudomonadota bacterium]
MKDQPQDKSLEKPAPRDFRELGGLYSLFPPAIDVDSPDNRSLGLIDWASQFGWMLKAYFRAEVRGLFRVPRGAALYVGNHNMGMLSADSGVFFYEAYKRLGIDALAWGLAHDAGMTIPGIGRLVAAVGGIRACHETAARVFARGGKIIVYPGGGLDAMRPFTRRNEIVFGGRTGYIRLALTENVPIVPVVAAGAHSAYIVLSDGQGLAKALGVAQKYRTDVWPLTLCLPWGVFLGPTPFFIPWPTRILMEALPPIRFDRTGPEAAADPEYVRACADQVETAMQDALTRLAADRAAKSPLKRLLKKIF